MAVREYTQVIKGKYDTKGAIKAMDILNNIPLTVEYFKTRPDVQQRIEKSINSNEYLAVYKRGTRSGFEYIPRDEGALTIRGIEIEDMSNTVLDMTKEENIISWDSIPKPNDFYIDDLKWKYLLRNIIRGKNIMMTGPSGCGKTDVTFKAAKALDREVIYFNLGATQDPRSTLIGNTHYSKDTGTYFSESLFVSAIQKPNTVILLDELSRAHPEAWNILMTVLDPIQRYLRLDEKSDSPTIKVAEGVSFIATANIGSEYTATRIIDRALLDRFAILEMDVLSYEQEYQLLSSKCTVNQETLLKLCDIIKDIRKEVKSDTPRISTTVSTRATLEIAELLTDAFTLEQAIEILVYPLFSDEGGNDSERTYVKQVVQKYLANDIGNRIHQDAENKAKGLQDIIKKIGE
jgi:nitric oxide reductase NorQ protein